MRAPNIPEDGVEGIILAEESFPSDFLSFLDSDDFSFFDSDDLLKRLIELYEILQTEYWPVRPAV